MREVLDEARVHPAIRDKIAQSGRDSLQTVQAAVRLHDIVIVGMRQNPFPKRARRLLDEHRIGYEYIEYGSYLSKWRERLPLKLWTGWPTFPMIFVKGVLIGGYDDLYRLMASGELEQLRAAPRAG
ncbi:MAG TPA: glutaredoxin [Polyangiaceae bacterium]|nr:glutaredoxin [Polyangiaceae bacterium]